MADDYADRDDARDEEIVTLLHQVGKRLIRSEKERARLSEIMADLEERSDQTERAFLLCQDRISKTESIFEKRQSQLEKTQQEQAARIEKAAAMADKIEEAMAQYAKINRRLDKAAQDKARLTRKVDRIEESVIETQEVLHSRAMVLLNEKEESRKAGIPSALQDDPDVYSTDLPWWRQHGPIRAGAVAAMVMLGVAGGWGISHVDFNNGAGKLGQFTPAARMASAPEALNTPPSPSYAELEKLESYAPAAAPSGNPDFAKAVERAVNAPAPAAKTVKTEAATESEDDLDPIEMDDAQLLASLEADPDALASKLNNIATGAGHTTVPDAPEKVKPAKTEAAAKAAATEKETAKPVAKVEKASFAPQQKVSEADTSAKGFIAAQQDKRPLAERIKPDANLPSVIKEVEKKAFEGVPEAQHDLAAIYTAGHGGVTVNYDRAALWFREAALQGVANARYNLGVLHHQGLGVTEDINVAVNWYRAAAEMGHPEAEYNLGIAYIEGIGTRYNPDQAAYYFEKAAKGGILEAAYNLGLIHENALTSNSRPDEALYWYKQAADMGSAEAKTAMDQLAKTLGLLPTEVERMYGTMKEEREGASNDARATEAQKPQKQAQSGFEYIEAQPLESTNTITSASYDPLPPIEENGDSAIEDDLATIAQIQEQLIRIGLYPGPADGQNDGLTGDAIRAYQARHDLREDGQPSRALLVHMMTSELGSGSNEYGSRAE